MSKTNGDEKNTVKKKKKNRVRRSNSDIFSGIAAVAGRGHRHGLFFP